MRRPVALTIRNQLLYHPCAHIVHAFKSECGRVGSQHHVIELQQGRMARWLFFKHIQARAGNCSVFQDPVKIGFIDDSAPGGIDQNGRRFHEAQSLFINESLCFWHQGYMQTDDVRCLEQIFDFHLLDALLLRKFCRPEGVMSHHFHIKALGPQRHAPADGSQPDQPEGFLPDLQTHDLGMFPAFFTQTAVAVNNFACHIQYQGKSVIGNGLVIGPRGMKNYSLVTAGRIDINRIQAGAHLGDGPDPRGHVQHRIVYMQVIAA